MRTLSFLLFLLMGVAVAQAAPDEIDSFVKDFDSMRLNGIQDESHLPADASPESVVADFVHSIGIKNYEPFQGYRIVEIKKIDQSSSVLNGYTVALVASAKGSKTIVLLTHRAGFWMVNPFYITTVP